MTIRHIVLFSFPQGRDASYLRRLEQGLAGLAAAIPEIASASWGEDITGRDDNFDFALVTDFADRKAYERYRVHPAHQKFIQDYMRDPPMKKVRVQFEFTQEKRS
jgi:hypothetical protein